MDAIRVYPGIIIDGDSNKVIFTLTHMSGETQEAYAHRCQEVFELVLSFVPKSEPAVFDFSDTSKYKQVGPTSWEAITPGYEPAEEKPTSERDTHFANYAEALRKEMHFSDLALYHAGKSKVEVEQAQREIIAQRAYDLVKYAYHYVDCVDEPLTWDEILSILPDMTEWPKPE